MGAMARSWFSYWYARIGAALAVCLLLAAPVSASLSQAYATTTPIAVGSLVSLDAKSTGSVVVADLNNTGRLFGVVVTPSSASISLGGGTSGQVQVATNGNANVLVTTAGGPIKVGDPIAVSPIAGVGQKAGARVRIIGTAQADFDGSGDIVTKRTIEDGSGKREVAIGQIPVVVAVATSTKEDGTDTTSSMIPSWAQGLTNTLAGKNVSPVRVIIAALILIVSLITVAVLLYAAVRNSIISIGRNPLSRKSVLAGLLQVIVIAIVILAVAAVAMYLVITR
jgi:hypothetical protein